MNKRARRNKDAASCEGTRAGQEIQAAGGLVIREAPDGMELILVHRKQYDDWSLPKGKVEPGEEALHAAIREVREETGCEVDCEGFAGETRYEVRGVPKVVQFWRMRLVSQERLDANDEIAETVWLRVPAAMARMSYESERGLVARSLAIQNTPLT
ncbi:MAG: NUDIX hydrolase [Bryobacteraceae bacterium]